MNKDSRKLFCTAAELGAPVCPLLSQCPVKMQTDLQCPLSPNDPGQGTHQPRSIIFFNNIFKPSDTNKQLTADILEQQQNARGHFHD